MVPGSHLLFPSGSVTPLVLCPIPPCIILDCTAIYILYMAKPSNPCQNHTLYIFYKHSYRSILSTSIDQLYSLVTQYPCQLCRSTYLLFWPSTLDIPHCLHVAHLLTTRDLQCTMSLPCIIYIYIVYALYIKLSIFDKYK